MISKIIFNKYSDFKNVQIQKLFKLRLAAVAGSAALAPAVADLRAALAPAAADLRASLAPAAADL